MGDEAYRSDLGPVPTSPGSSRSFHTKSPHHRSHFDSKDLKNSVMKHLQPIEATGSISQAPG